MTAPKVFVSYSWTSQEHMDWVLELAAILRTSGVDAILDKWHLKEGQDAHAFMERMVTDSDVTKVAVICDHKYVERSNLREGGVGAESQIMSAELYGKVDQTKFVAVCREKDASGRALLPTFFRSRIYIDLSPEADFSLGLEQLLRWCFDRPLYVEPELGKAPAFLDRQVAPIVGLALSLDRVFSDPSLDAKAISKAALALFDELSANTIDLTIEFASGDVSDDDAVLAGIEGLVPILSRVTKALNRGLRADAEVISQSYHDYLESIVPSLERGNTSWSADVTKFYANYLLVLFVAISVRHRRFRDARTFLEAPFVKEDYDGFTASSVTYGVFGTHPQSLEARNKRLNMNRASLHADLIKQVCEASGLPFKEYLQADFLIYVKGLAGSDEDRHGMGRYSGWWPTSAIYIADRHSALPVFVRAEQPDYRDELIAFLGLSGKADLEILITSVKDGQVEVPRWQSAFSRLDVLALMNTTKIVTSYDDGGATPDRG